MKGGHHVVISLYRSVISCLSRHDVAAIFPGAFAIFLHTSLIFPLSFLSPSLLHFFSISWSNLTKITFKLLETHANDYNNT